MTQATQLLKSIRLSALKVVESSGECVESDGPEVGSSVSVESVMEEQGQGLIRLTRQGQPAAEGRGRVYGPEFSPGDQRMLMMRRRLRRH